LFDLGDAGIRLTLLSTGLLLKKCASSVAASFDDVIVSLDGPRRYTTLSAEWRGLSGFFKEAFVH